MPATGDSALTQAFYELGTMKRVELTVLFDSGDGSFVATAITKGKLSGYLIAMETNPSATAPTDNYDITLVDGDGVDILGAAGANRHTTTSQMVALPFGTYFHWPVMPDKTYTLTISGNSVNSAGTVITLFYIAA
jgi:hypothetical protein